MSNYTLLPINEPVHIHDCECCIHLATFIEDGRIFDAYVCKAHGEGSMVLRYHSDGPEYYSQPMSFRRHLKELGGVWKSMSEIMDDWEVNGSLKP